MAVVVTIGEVAHSASSKGRVFSGYIRDVTQLEEMNRELADQKKVYSGKVEEAQPVRNS